MLPRTLKRMCFVLRNVPKPNKVGMSGDYESHGTKEAVARRVFRLAWSIKTIVAVFVFPEEKK